MQTSQSLRFGVYRLDPQTGQLWRGKQEVRLTGKASALLRSLVGRAGQVVTKEELFAAVWPETVVSDAALTSCIQELRQVLRDDAKRPHYIATIHRRGFQFIGKVARSQYPVVRRKKAEAREAPLATGNWPLTTHLVGRETELAYLQTCLEKALSGERQLVFVTGEPGIGKTTVVEAFLDHVGAHGDASGVAERVWIGWGQCVEHYGAGEAYLPVLEALGRLCREEDGKEVIALLRQQAPTWLVQMPALLSTAELEELQRRTAGVTRERMLRELAEAVEAITLEHALLLWFEDLHWSDVSTLDWLASVARRQERARLLIIGTYRPVEVLTREHPLKGVKHELQLHGQCEELALDFLSETAVAEYIAQRFAVGAQHAAPLQELAHVIHQRTDGNPLFMVNVTNELVSRGIVAQKKGRWTLPEKGQDIVLDVPENLRQLIERQVERISPAERAVLEAASVAGADFSAAAVAAEQSTEAVEAQCDALVRREQFLRARGTREWPDGTMAARYGFVHALYQEVLYEQISASRRVRLHRQIGERGEAAYRERTREIAAELAVHFERGRDYRRAVQYLHQAGENAIRRNAYQEAISLLTRGLELLQTLPDTSERTQQELALQTTLGASLMATRGFAAAEVERTYARARELCQRVEDTRQIFPALFGLWAFYDVRANLQTAREVGEQLLALAQRQHDPALLVPGYRALGETFFWLGEVVQARTHLEQGIALYDPQQHRAHALLYGPDHGVSGLGFVALTLWVLGYPDQALQRSQETLVLARHLSHPFSLVFTLMLTTYLHQFRREEQAVLARTEMLIALATEHGFAQGLATGTRYRGWALTVQRQTKEGIALMRQGSNIFQATGAGLSRPYVLALLAEALGKIGQVEEGLCAFPEALALVEKNGDRVYEAEVYRIRGELTLVQKGKSQKANGKSQKSKAPGTQHLTPSTQTEAEACFHKAIEIARRQSAKSWELRATMSLARLWQQQGKKKEARQMLAEVYNWFTEGFDTKDLQEAKALLEELSQ